MFRLRSKDSSDFDDFTTNQQAVALSGRAILALQSGDVASALKDIRAALRKAPDVLQVRSNAIALYHNLGDLKQAYRIFNSTTGKMIISNDSPIEMYVFYNYSGRLLIAMNDNERATIQLNAALAMAESKRYSEDKEFVIRAEVNENSSTTKQDIDEIKELLALTHEA